MSVLNGSLFLLHVNGSVISHGENMARVNVDHSEYTEVLSSILILIPVVNVPIISCVYKDPSDTFINKLVIIDCLNALGYIPILLQQYKWVHTCVPWILLKNNFSGECWRMILSALLKEFTTCSRLLWTEIFQWSLLFIDMSMFSTGLGFILMWIRWSWASFSPFFFSYFLPAVLSVQFSTLGTTGGWTSAWEERRTSSMISRTSSTLTTGLCFQGESQ